MPTQLVREPLFHFFCIGLALFALDSLRASQVETAKRIYVPERVYAEVSTNFQTGFGRMPSAAELKPLIDTWVSNEVMYREAKAMQLDQGDEMIRERVIQKMRSMIAGQIDKSQPEEVELRTFFEAHRSNYDQPAFYGFTFVKVSGDLSHAQSLATQWNATRETVSTTPGQRVARFKLRPEDNVRQLLGEDIAAQLASLEPQVWTAVEGAGGYAVLRLDQRIAPRPGMFEKNIPDIQKRWAEWKAQQQGAEKIRAMRANYDVILPPVPEKYMRAAQSANENREALPAAKSRDMLAESR